MGDFGTSQLLPLVGFLFGLAIGGVARASRFCTFGAIEDYVLAERLERMRAWGLAIAVAMVFVTVLHTAGIARIEETFYLGSTVSFSGTILGGLMFGFGMAMVGTCGFGILVRLGGGDLKALVGAVFLGLSGYATARGIIAPVRTWLNDVALADLSGFGGQGLPHLLAPILGLDALRLWLPVGFVLALTLFVWCFRSAAFRSSRRDIVAGVVIGLVVAAGFAATGILGNDPFDPQRVESMTYALPPGETLVYLLTFTGASLDYGVCTILGTITGAFLVALLRSELCLEAFDGRREMRRHLVGALLMGFGGVLALGCTVGQGMSGMSTLSVSSPIALFCIYIGASFGIHYLVSEGTGDAVRSFFALRDRA